MTDPATIAAGPQTRREARAWIRRHWADLIGDADMGAVADMQNDHLDAVWSDECRRIARRLSATRTALLEMEAKNGR